MFRFARLENWLTVKEIKTLTFIFKKKVSKSEENFKSAKISGVKLFVVNLIWIILFNENRLKYFVQISNMAAIVLLVVGTTINSYPEAISLILARKLVIYFVYSVAAINHTLFYQHLLKFYTSATHSSSNKSRRIRLDWQAWSPWASKSTSFFTLNKEPINAK